MSLIFLAVSSPDGINEKDIGKSIKKALAEGSAFHVAVVPGLVRDYEFLFWSKDALTALLCGRHDEPRRIDPTDH